MLAGVSPEGSTLTMTSAGRLAAGSRRRIEAELPPLDRALLLALGVEEGEEHRAAAQRGQGNDAPDWSRRVKPVAARAPGSHSAWPWKAGRLPALAEGERVRVEQVEPATGGDPDRAGQADDEGGPAKGDARLSHSSFRCGLRPSAA